MKQYMFHCTLFSSARKGTTGGRSLEGERIDRLGVRLDKEPFFVNLNEREVVLLAIIVTRGCQLHAESIQVEKGDSMAQFVIPRLMEGQSSKSSLFLLAGLIYL